MRRLLPACCLIALALWLSPRCEAQDASGHAAATKYEVTLHGPDGEKEATFDISKKEDRLKLTEYLEAGHIHELKKAEAPDLFAVKRWDLGLWSIVIFVLLFLGLSKFAWKPMLQGLTRREENIRSALDQAEKTRQEAMNLQGEVDAKMHAAGGEAARIMDVARREAQGLKEQFLGEAKAEIQAERDRQRREIDTAKDQALQEIWQKSVTLAALMSTKAIRRGLAEADHRRLLDESLAELKTAGGEFARRAIHGAGL
jgi:F-type H+-transporting ATPase subunit b